MALAEESPIRKLTDQVIRQSLLHPAHLQAFLQEAVPQFADRFDCDRARLLDREFPLEDWRHREADLPFEVPFRLDAEEVWALVCSPESLLQTGRECFQALALVRAQGTPWKSSLRCCGRPASAWRAYRAPTRCAGTICCGSC